MTYVSRAMMDATMVLTETEFYGLMMAACGRTALFSTKHGNLAARLAATVADSMRMLDKGERAEPRVVPCHGNTFDAGVLRDGRRTLYVPEVLSLSLQGRNALLRAVRSRTGHVIMSTELRESYERYDETFLDELSSHSDVSIRQDGGDVDFLSSTIRRMAEKCGTVCDGPAVPDVDVLSEEFLSDRMTVAARTTSEYIGQGSFLERHRRRLIENAVLLTKIKGGECNVLYSEEVDGASRFVRPKFISQGGGR